jgi:hypothetical protein
MTRNEFSQIIHIQHKLSTYSEQKSALPGRKHDDDRFHFAHLMLKPIFTLVAIVERFQPGMSFGRHFWRQWFQVMMPHALLPLRYP